MTALPLPGSGPARSSGALGARVLVIEADAQLRGVLQRRHGVAAGDGYSQPDALESLLATGMPLIAVFGPSFASELGLEYLRGLTPAHPQLGAVLLVEAIDVALLQRALRSGVRDVLPVDIDERGWNETLVRLAAALQTTKRRGAAAGAAGRGRVITTFSTKGGVGKSVTATNLAAAMARRSGRSVAIVDADLQFGDVAVLLGVPPRHTVMDAAAAVSIDAEPQIVEALLEVHPATGLKVLPAPVEPEASEAITPAQMLAIVQTLREVFDFVVVDLPPHFNDMVLTLLDEADDVLLVASMDIPSIKNLKIGLQTLNLLEIAGSKLRLLLNRANAKVSLDVAEVEKVIGIAAEFRVPSDIAVPQAVNSGSPVVLDRPRSPAGVAFWALADVFMASDAAEVPEAKGGRDDERGRIVKWGFRR